MKDVSALEAMKLVSEQKALIVDMRTKFEQDEFSLDQTVLLPVDLENDDFEGFCEQIKQQAALNKEVILMCRSGVRSKFAQAELAKRGVQSSNLLGGIIALANAR